MDNGIIELVGVEIDGAHPEEERRDEFFGGKEAYRAVVLLAGGIEDDDGGGPFDFEFVRQRAVRQHLEGDHAAHDEIGNFCIRVRNCTHLFAADSAGVEKIEQNRLFLRLPARQGRAHLCFPDNNVPHNLTSF